MIGFRGRFGAIQYMPQKPTKWGIKLYSIADSILDSIVYTGSETHTNTTIYSTLPKTTQVYSNEINHTILRQRIPPIHRLHCHVN